MRILITGAGGQLGRDLMQVLRDDHELAAMTRRELDVTDEKAVLSAVADFRPDTIIHAAAYTQVDLAESQIDEAYRINSYGSRNVAIAARQAGAKLVYVSTDYVFDGKKGSPYNEKDRPNPLSVYGHSKLHGEKFVQLICDRYFIVRTSWLYGAYGSNFVTKVLALAEQKNELSMVSDQFGSPTYTHDLAVFVEQLIETDRYGLYHASNRGSCSRYEFAREILRIKGYNHIQLTPVSADQFTLPAVRPDDSAFDDSAIREQGFPRFRLWQEALQSFLLEDLPAKEKEEQANGKD